MRKRGLDFKFMRRPKSKTSAPQSVEQAGILQLNQAVPAHPEIGGTDQHGTSAIPHVAFASDFGSRTPGIGNLEEEIRSIHHEPVHLPTSSVQAQEREDARIAMGLKHKEIAAEHERLLKQYAYYHTLHDYMMHRVDWKVMQAVKKDFFTALTEQERWSGTSEIALWAVFS